MSLKQCLSRIKGTVQWHISFNHGQPFACDEGLMEMMIELAKERYPNLEFQVIDSTLPPPAFQGNFGI